MLLRNSGTAEIGGMGDLGWGFPPLLVDYAKTAAAGAAVAAANKLAAPKGGPASAKTATTPLPKSQGMSTGAKAAIGVGAGLALLFGIRAMRK